MTADIIITKQDSENTLEQIGFFTRLKIKCCEIDTKLGISQNIIIITYFFILFFIYLGIFQNFFSNLIGIFYPLICSIKSLDTDRTEEDKIWLTYWLVFSLYLILEIILGYFLRLLPYYYFFKTGLFFYLYLPNTKGAEKIYNKFIKSTFKTCEVNVEKLLTDLQQDAKNISKNAKNLIHQHSTERTNFNKKSDSNLDESFINNESIPMSIKKIQ